MLLLNRKIMLNLITLNELDLIRSLNADEILNHSKSFETIYHFSLFLHIIFLLNIQEVVSSFKCDTIINICH